MTVVHSEENLVVNNKQCVDIICLLVVPWKFDILCQMNEASTGQPLTNSLSAETLLFKELVGMFSLK